MGGRRLTIEPELELRLRPDAAETEGLPIFEQLPTVRVNALLVWGDAFVCLYQRLYTRNIVRSFHMQLYGLAVGSLGEKLHGTFAGPTAGCCDSGSGQ
jgi:hypothetical protein|eukprot:COSAG01_NODE_13686_length_1548_cov_3.473430_1_plen_98_part_00